MGVVVVRHASVVAQHVHAPALFTQVSDRFCRCDQVSTEYQSDVGWCQMVVAECLHSYDGLEG